MTYWTLREYEGEDVGLVLLVAVFGGRGTCSISHGRGERPEYHRGKG